jgi:hypothetical protein
VVDADDADWGLDALDGDGGVLEGCGEGVDGDWEILVKGSPPDVTVVTEKTYQESRGWCYPH